jgi:glutamate dehydrogenase
LVFKKYPWLGVTRGEIITGLSSILHPIMSDKNPFAFSRSNIFDLVTKSRNIQHASEIADLLLDRFHPKHPLSDSDFSIRKENLENSIIDDVEDTFAKDMLMKMVDVVAHTLKTNVYLEDRYALGLRLDPRAIQETYQTSEEQPFGVMYCHGRRFNAFHVRFKDIARGGMRLVTPTSPEHHALESARQYDECYGLAYAQQLKNKDIPEGGSKAVNLINCDGLSPQAKQFVMRKSVKAFTNTVLDLIVDTEETRERVVDRHGQREVIYLGPDEQVSRFRESCFVP